MEHEQNVLKIDAFGGYGQENAFASNWARRASGWFVGNETLLICSASVGRCIARDDGLRGPTQLADEMLRENQPHDHPAQVDRPTDRPTD